MKRKLKTLPLFLLNLFLASVVVYGVLRYSLVVPSHVKTVSVNDLSVTWIDNGTEVTFIEWGTMYNWDNKTLPLINVTSTTDVPIWLSVLCKLNAINSYNLVAWCIERSVDIATRGYDTPTIMLAPYESVTLELTLTIRSAIADMDFDIVFRAFDSEV